MIFKSSEFKTSSKPIKHVYLDERETNALYDLSLTGNLEKVRDIFVIGCRTGLCVSDYVKCVSDSVESSGLICIDETEKTGEPIYIPIHWQVRDILNKRGGVPPQMPDQKINELIKTVCKMAGFTQQIKDTRKRKKTDEEWCAKYELIITHPRRRSCATNLYMAGFDLYFIQGGLGHAKIETTIRYLGIIRKSMTLKMVDHPYFKRPCGT